MLLKMSSIKHGNKSVVVYLALSTTLKVDEAASCLLLPIVSSNLYLTRIYLLNSTFRRNTL